MTHNLLPDNKLHANVLPAGAKSCARGWQGRRHAAACRLCSGSNSARLPASSLLHHRQLINSLSLCCCFGQAVCHTRFKSSTAVCTCCITYCSYICLQSNIKQVPAHKGWHVNNSKAAIMYQVMCLGCRRLNRWRRRQEHLQAGRCGGGRGPFLGLRHHCQRPQPAGHPPAARREVRRRQWHAADGGCAQGAETVGSPVAAMPGRQEVVVFPTPSAHLCRSSSRFSTAGAPARHDRSYHRLDNWG